MNKAIASQRSYLKKENRLYGTALVAVPGPFPTTDSTVTCRVWRSKDYLAQLIRERGSQKFRLSINRTMIDESGHWEGGISWDELQRIKSECLGPDALCVEVFPPDQQIVNVANIRHLWILPAGTQIGWCDAAENADEQRGNA